jgi:hypothetical protein
MVPDASASATTGNAAGSGEPVAAQLGTAAVRYLPGHEHPCRIEETAERLDVCRMPKEFVIPRGSRIGPVDERGQLFVKGVHEAGAVAVEHAPILPRATDILVDISQVRSKICG